MHLLAATPGQVDDGKEPVDLGQTPADVVFISAADTELAALSRGARRDGRPADAAARQPHPSRAPDVGRPAYRRTAPRNRAW